MSNSSLSNIKETIRKGLIHCLICEYKKNAGVGAGNIEMQICEEFSRICDLIVNGYAGNITTFDEFLKLEPCVNTIKYFQSEPLAIISFDADKIQDYIFESSKFINILGASSLIKSFNDSVVKNIILEKGLIDENIIYSGGGGGLIITPAFMAEEVKVLLEKTFASHTISGTLSCVFIKVWPWEMVIGKIPIEGSPVFKGESKFLERWYSFEDYKKSWRSNKCFGELVNLLASKLKFEKSSITKYKNLASSFESEIQDLCPSCGRRQRKNSELCLVCLHKENVGHKTKYEEEFSSSFENIDRSYLGIISADGNSMGSILLKLKTIVDYCIFSSAVNDLLKNISEDVKKICNGRYSIPICGGDDILAIVPKDKAFAVASLIMKSFSSAFENNTLLKELFASNHEEYTYKMIQNIGVSVGVLFTHPKFPAKYFVEYAEALQKNAKTKCSLGLERSAIDFMILSKNSPLNDSLTEYRKLNHLSCSGKEYIMTTDKPYTEKSFNKFIENVTALKENVAVNQLYQFRNFLKDGRQMSFMNFAYQVARNDNIKKWLEKCGIRWDNSTELKNFLWEKREMTGLIYYSTKIQDMLEALKCIIGVGGKEKNESEN